MKDSKDSGKSTDFNKTLFAHIPHDKAMALLIPLLTEEIPQLYDLKYSEGPANLQAEGICEFILRKFKTLNVDEIREAFELNAAGQLPNRTEFYGKMALNQVGSLLSNFRTYKANTGQRGRQEAMNTEINVERELISDLRNLSVSGDRWNLTRYIDEKWEWLKANQKDFDSSWDEKEIDELEKKIVERRKNMKDSIIPDKWVNNRRSAESDYKMLRIRAYLEKMVPAFKAKENETDNRRQG